jgi:hypothetical protein
VYSGAITVGATETLLAIAAKAGYANSPVTTAAYTIASGVPAPVFSPAAGTYTSPQTVTITDTMAGATIYYTTDGTTPTTSSTVYAGAIWQCVTQTLKAIAVKTGYANSQVTSAAYVIATVLPTPTFSLAGGTTAYATPQTVTILDANSVATIYYTTNGTTPTTSSIKYTGAITVSVTETVQAIAVGSGYTNSAVASVLYTITPGVPAPVFSLAAGTYTTTQTVTISDALAGTTIYYTTNGTVPTTSSAKYTGSISVSATETVEAIAVENGYSNSPIATAVYTIASGVAAPVFSPSPGTFTSPQTVTITDTTAGATIYYTTNGTAPTTSSTVYMGAIWQSSTQTLQAIAVKSGYANSMVATATYTIAPILPTPTFSLAGGTAAYPSPQTVSILDANAGATIYYTTNGTTPTTSSTKYTGAITVSVTETVEAIAVEAGHTNSAIGSVLYTISGSSSDNKFAGFSIRASSNSATAAPGGSANYTLTVAPLSPTTKFPAAVDLLASGLPAGATYTFSPVSVPAGAGATGVTLTVQLPQTTAATGLSGGVPGRFASWMAPPAFALLLLPFAGRLRRIRKQLGRSVSVLLLAAAIAALTVLSGCGSMNSLSGPGLQSYSVTVTGTTASISQSTTVTLTVTP